jgi:HSP20 family protein
MKSNPASGITRFDPFEDPFEDLFRGFFLRPLNLEPRGLTRQQGQMKLDVTETQKDYHVMAEIPGVRKEDINVTIDGDQIAITAETKKEEEVKNKEGMVVHSERYYGKLYRAFSLGEEVDQAHAQAKYHDGVLELTLPKAAVVSPRKNKIEVH